MATKRECWQNSSVRLMFSDLGAELAASLRKNCGALTKHWRPFLAFRKVSSSAPATPTVTSGVGGTGDVGVEGDEGGMEPVGLDGDGGESCGADD